MALRRIALCVAAFLAVAADAVAQDLPAERLFAMAPGNRWEYFYLYQRVEDDEVTDEGAGYAIVEALRDTVVAGEPWVIYTIQDLDEDGDEIQAGVFRGRVVEPDTWEATHVSGERYGHYLGTLLPNEIELGEQSSGGEVTIQGTPHPVDATAFDRYGSGCGPGANCYADRSHAADLGLYLSHSTQLHWLFEKHWTHTLGYAEVGGVIYGAPVLSSDPPATPPEPATTLAVQAVPNPTLGSVSLLLSGGWTGTLDVRVYDALGRRVYEATRAALGSPTLSVGGLPPGTYTLQVSSEAGDLASTRFSRL